MVQPEWSKSGTLNAHAQKRALARQPDVVGVGYGDTCAAAKQKAIEDATRSSQLGRIGRYGPSIVQMCMMGLLDVDGRHHPAGVGIRTISPFRVDNGIFDWPKCPRENMADGCCRLPDGTYVTRGTWNAALAACFRVITDAPPTPRRK